MKLNFKSALSVITFVIILLSGCNKAELKSDEPELQLRANETPLSQLILNPKDKADELINEENVKLATVLKNIVVQKEINQFIVETAQKNEGEVMYEQLFEKFPHLKSLFANTVIGNRENTSTVVQNGETYDFVRKDIGYNAMLYVPNFTVSRPSDKAIVSPEIQIYREIGEGDIYFAWDLRRGNGRDSVEIFITEKEAMTLNVPVVMTSLKHMAFLKPFSPRLRAPNETSWGFSTVVDNKLSARANFDEAIWVRQANILYNYDGGTTAELCVTGQFIANDGSMQAWVRGSANEWFNISNHNQTCNLISTNDNNQFTHLGNGSTSGNNVSTFWTDKSYFFNAWERDWGSSKKPLGSAVHAGRTAQFEGARKYTDEWYIYNPSRVQTQVDAVPMSFLFNNTGTSAFPNPDPDNNPNNDCSSSSPFKNIGIKAELAFTRGWF